MALLHWTDFFEDLQSIRGRSQNTVLAYRRDLELWDSYQQLSSDIPGFYEFMKKHGLSPRSQARVISSLRTYFRFCQSRGMKIPELRELRPPKAKIGLPKPISELEFRQLYVACETDNLFRTARNQITLLMLFGLGCRVSELISLDLHDFSETDRWLSVTGKGQKQRLVPLTEHLCQELKQYLITARPHLLGKGTGNQSILINDRGSRPSRVDIWRWLSAWSSQAGLTEPVGPHRFRHGCATALLQSGADLRSIQMLLGHASIQTTQIYTSVNSQNLVDAIRDHHPLSQLKAT